MPEEIPEARPSEAANPVFITFLREKDFEVMYAISYLIYSSLIVSLQGNKNVP